ncbi:murein hydrolase activator EnvC family protein [Sphingomonas baiyangensis]|nr:peptidoglycan DD-metalloendopeptidase family protein [Sphingomonas baiyangensis]
MPATTGAQAPSIDDERRALAAANEASRLARIRSEELERQADAARDEAAEAAARRAAVAARAEQAEADIAAARARILLVDRELAAARARLEARRAPTTQLVAALQSLARRPAALGLLQPGSTRDAVHVRALLATVVPVVRARSDAVRGELAEVRRLREGAALAARSLADGRARLEEERLGLLQLEAASRLRSRDLGRSALIESDRALALGEEARDIVDRMSVLDAAIATRGALEALPGPLPRPLPRPDAAAEATPSAGPPPYRLPVAGRIVAGLGELSPSGVRSRGLTIATWAGAPAVAPAAGTVAFARGFPGYRTVVILDHGDGWTSLVSGLDAAAVRRGERVAAGAAIGRAPAGDAPRVTVELRRRGRPFDIVPLLR